MGLSAGRSLGTCFSQCLQTQRSLPMSIAKSAQTQYAPARSRREHLARGTGQSFRRLRFRLVCVRLNRNDLAFSRRSQMCPRRSQNDRPQQLGLPESGGNNVDRNGWATLGMSMCSTWQQIYPSECGAKQLIRYIPAYLGIPCKQLYVFNGGC